MTIILRAWLMQNRLARISQRFEHRRLETPT
jgi:hypothetical protein